MKKLSLGKVTIATIGRDGMKEAKGGYDKSLFELCSLWETFDDTMCAMPTTVSGGTNTCNCSV